MYNLQQYRSWFPHLLTGKIYLNHAAISPLSTRVNHAVDAFLESRTVGSIDPFLETQRASALLKENLAKILNASAERIGFVQNTSEGLNILANGLEWKSGDRILLNDSEFPANVVPFLNLKRSGVEIDFVRTDNGKIYIEEIEKLITPKTKLLSLSFVQFLSGYKADLETIGKLCREKQILFCVDAIQGLGVSPMDVQNFQIDFLSCGGHKWLMGLMGLGFIYLTEELQQRIHQANAGWTSNKNFFSDFLNYRIDFDETARRYENGTQSYLAVAALGKSTQTLLEIGIEAIQSHIHSITEKIFSSAEEMGCKIITPHHTGERAGIVTVQHPKAKEIFQELSEQNIIVSMREGMIRIAPHFYNSEEDISVFLSMFRSLNEEFS
ncbi:MAG: aminotransferase class V-fold PLP-dependent enzyme [Bacteroidetes bacterium]|nr:aminotransferase class V-fold PLP-dependent enzyme [Bacteroidota bacterium]